jgi:DNA polymerase III alpha subunit (gram-positive type)
MIGYECNNTEMDVTNMETQVVCVSTTTSNTTPIPIKKKRKISCPREKCDICKQRNKATKAPCKKCRQCCLDDGGCSTHKFKITLNDNITNYEVLLLDFETTDLQNRAPTDCYVYNLTTNQSLQFPKYIKPRCCISPEAASITGITNSMVVNGIDEKIAIQQIAKFLPSKCIIVAHNAPFDREVFKRTFEYWRTRDVHFDGLPNNNIVFLDSKQLLGRRVKAQSKKLGDIYYHLFNKPILNQHTASADVNAMLEIFNKLFGNDSIKNLKQYLNRITDLKGSALIYRNNKLLKGRDLDNYFVYTR